MTGDDALFAAARDAAAKAHAVYSEFPVGVAIRAASGEIYAGCNVENASYPEGWCAETTAIGHMIMGGDREIETVLVYAPKKPRATPCGGCRQRILEFATPETRLLLTDETGIVDETTIAELLPEAFELEP